MKTYKKFGKKYTKVQITDLSINDVFMNLSWKPARLKSIEGKTCTIAWVYGIENKDGDTYNGIWSNDTVWIELKEINN